jgi:hypothetical protein
MYSSAITKLFAALYQHLLDLNRMIRTQMRQHAPEDGQRRGGLLIEPFESGTWKPLQVLERCER